MSEFKLNQFAMVLAVLCGLTGSAQAEIEGDVHYIKASQNCSSNDGFVMDGNIFVQSDPGPCSRWFVKKCIRVSKVNEILTSGKCSSEFIQNGAFYIADLTSMPERFLKIESAPSWFLVQCLRLENTQLYYTLNQKCQSGFIRDAQPLMFKEDHLFKTKDTDELGFQGFSTRRIVTRCHRN